MMMLYRRFSSTFSLEGTYLFALSLLFLLFLSSTGCQQEKPITTEVLIEAPIVVAVPTATAPPLPTITPAIPTQSPSLRSSPTAVIEVTSQNDSPPAFVPVINVESLPTVTASPSPTRHNSLPEANNDVASFVLSQSIEMSFDGHFKDIAIPQGMRAAPVKIGFHIGPGGNQDGLGDYMARLDAVGVPVFLKSIDAAGSLWELQEMRKKSGVPHILVFRATGGVPDYNKEPLEAAREHWAFHASNFPAELDKKIVWLETLNEVDKTIPQWWGPFVLETARLAMQEGFRWAAFGWSTGEPEDWFWKTPEMLEFLRLAGQHPDRLAIALHEYSLEQQLDAQECSYPFCIGRFQWLFAICDEYTLPRPTVLITEWGWTAFSTPEPQAAISDIRWGSRLYAMYPEVQGAAIWYLGPEFLGIANDAQRIIAPLAEYAAHHYFLVPEAPVNIDPYLFVEEEGWREESHCRWCYQMKEGPFRNP